MHGTRQQLVVIALLAAPSVAHAFHNGKVFDDPPGAGGGGGLFYSGSLRDRGWDCTACHEQPRGRLELALASQPPELLESGRYTPGAAYAITVAMADPSRQLGMAATRSNFNGMVASFLDDAGIPAGTITNFAPASFYLRSSAILATDSVTVNETSWTFTWTAPMTSGEIEIDIAVVDGNGADQTGTSTLTDPLADDVALFGVVVTPTASRLRAWTSPSLAPESSASRPRSFSRMPVTRYAWSPPRRERRRRLPSPARFGFRTVSARRTASRCGPPRRARG